MKHARDQIFVLAIRTVHSFITEVFLTDTEKFPSSTRRRTGDQVCGRAVSTFYRKNSELYVKYTLKNYTLAFTVQEKLKMCMSN